MTSGLGVGFIMTFLALSTGTPFEPIPILYILSSARWVYGSDRYLDGKVEDNPESLACALLCANMILWYNDLSILIAPEILSLVMYPEFKKNFPLLKPFYVGTFWTGAITVVPHLISNIDINYDHTLSIGLLATAISNLADIDDVYTDENNQIYTIPSRYGVTNTRLLSTGLFIGSVYKSGIVPHAFKTNNTLRRKILVKNRLFTTFKKNIQCILTI
tara:strand:+ start:1242 stop:1892 length:651 start_codon:yes stop_codon:yes gene_type:complete